MLTPFRGTTLAGGTDGVGQRADAIDVDGDGIAREEGPHTGGGARQDDIAGEQGHEGRSEGHKLFDGEDHIVGGSHLAQFVIDMAGDQQVRGIKVGLDPRAEGTESVEAFAAGPLVVTPLQVAGGDVVADGVAEDVVQGVLGFDPAPGLADDDGQLGFMLDVVGLGRDEDGFAGCDDRAGRLEEEEGYLGDIDGMFFGMGDVIAPDADDLAGFAGRQQAHGGQGIFGVVTSVVTEGVALDRPDEVLVDPAIARGEVFIGEAHDFHSLSSNSIVYNSAVGQIAQLVRAHLLHR